MKKFSGIDLHSNNSVVVVSDEVDHIVYQRRLPAERNECLDRTKRRRRAIVSCLPIARVHAARRTIFDNVIRCVHRDAPIERGLD